eukprot:c50310_g1_i1 orf=2-151(-)
MMILQKSHICAIFCRPDSVKNYLRFSFVQSVQFWNVKVCGGFFILDIFAT